MAKNTPTEERDIQLAVIAERTKVIQEKVKSIEDKLERDYATKDEIDPIRKIVYGIASVVFLSVAAAILGQVLKT